VDEVLRRVMQVHGRTHPEVGSPIDYRLDVFDRCIGGSGQGREIGPVTVEVVGIERGEGSELRVVVYGTRPDGDVTVDASTT
jgi:hypothetical protein